MEEALMMDKNLAMIKESLPSLHIKREIPWKVELEGDFATFRASSPLIDYKILVDVYKCLVISTEGEGFKITEENCNSFSRDEIFNLIQGTHNNLVSNLLSTMDFYSRNPGLK